MTRILVLRHGITGWNADRRLQGHRDVSLNAEGREMAAAWRLPDDFARGPIVASPLARCVETAEIVRANHPGLAPLETDARLKEKSWGVWEGCLLTEMEAALGAAAHAADNRPEGGESRLDMLPRIRAFLADMAAAGGDRVVVTHRGVIRAIYALATGWDLTGETPDRLSRRRAQIFRLNEDGTPAVETLNLRIAPAGGPEPEDEG